MGQSEQQQLYLCIDQGSHASRALVFDSDLNIVTQASKTIATHQPRQGWVEHDADALLNSVRDVIREVSANLGAAVDRLDSAGLATQRSSMVCWDRVSGQSLSPVLSWRDVRGESELAPLIDRTQDIRATTGLRPSPHYGASKMRWCIDHLSSVRTALVEKRLAIGPLASFLAYKLCRERPYVVDPCNASRTLLWDYRTGDWSPWIRQLAGLEQITLPDCVENRHWFGLLADLEKPVPLRLMTGDASAVPFALDGLAAGRASVQFGTGAFIQRAASAIDQIDERLLASVIWQDAEGAMLVAEGTVNGCSSAVHHVGESLGLNREQLKHEGLSLIGSDADLPVYLNGIGGLGSPDWITDFESRFVGTGDPLQLVAAAHESVVFLINRNLKLMAEGLDDIRVGGGLSRCDPLCQCLADLSGIKVVRPAVEEATALGLAVLLAGHCPRTAEKVFAPGPADGLKSRFHSWSRLMPELDEQDT